MVQPQKCMPACRDGGTSGGQKLTLLDLVLTSLEQHFAFHPAGSRSTEFELCWGVFGVRDLP